MLTQIKVPSVPDAKWSFQKFNRRAQDWAIVGASVPVNNGQSGVSLVNMHLNPHSVQPQWKKQLQVGQMLKKLANRLR